jgi:hypothetical protein
MQYERFDGIEASLKEYVKEVAFDPGYPHGPLEQEAERLSDGVIKSFTVVVHPSAFYRAWKSDPGSVQPRTRLAAGNGCLGHTL